MEDEEIIKTIGNIPILNQRQYSTDEQLRHLRWVADRLGLYDASDIIRNILERGE